MMKKETKKIKESISKVERKNEKSEFWNKLDNILDNKADNYFFYPFVLLVGLTLLGQYYKQTTFGSIIDIALTAVCFAWVGIIIYKLCRKLTKIAVIWPLIVSLVGLISSFITSFASQTFASDISFIVGMFFMEVFLIYFIVCDIYGKKNRVNRVIISSVLFVVLGYVTIFYSSYGLEDNTIFNSLIGIFSAIVGGGLTLGGVAWTIKHEKEENRKEERQDLLNTCSLLSFEKIDLINYDGFKVSIDNPFPNTMGINGSDKQGLKNNRNIFFRFVFRSANNIPVKNITFENLSIYSSYVNQKNMGTAYSFTNINKGDKSVNISLIDINTYQIGVFLVSSFKNNKIGELYNSFTKLNENQKVFIDAVYSTTNINNVSYKAELKFTCKIKMVDENNMFKIVVSDYEHGSNWIVEQPNVIEDK